MSHVSHPDAGAADRKYAALAKVSRIAASYFVEHGIPAEYVAAILGSEPRPANSGLTIQGIIDFHVDGVDPGYVLSCICMGVPAFRIQEFWHNGVPIEFIQVFIDR